MTTAARPLPLPALPEQETAEAQILAALDRLPVGTPFTAQEATEYAEDRTAIDAGGPGRSNRDVMAAARAHFAG